MRHQYDGRKFGRNTSHRTAMFRNLANALIAQEQIVTTTQKAKEARRVVDRLVTLAKRSVGNKTTEGPARRLAFDRTRDEDVVKKLFSTLADRYKTRAGGYTRVLKLSDTRRGDGAEMALIELVDRPELDRKKKVKAAPAKSADGEGGEVAPEAARDPFKGFRKMFGSKQGKAAGSQKSLAKQGSMPRKTGGSRGGGGGSSSGGE